MLTSSAVVAEDVADVVDSVEVVQVASDSPADVAPPPPLLAQPLVRRPAPSLRFEVVLGRVSLAA